MENKLQELTQKLYDEGLSKGRQESERLLNEAQAKAKRIISDAETEASRIKKDAESYAEDTKKNTLTELNLAGKQVIGTLKANLNDMIVAKSVKNTVGDAAIDPDFIKQVLLEVSKNWNGSSNDKISLQAMLPASLKKELSERLETSIKQTLGEGLEIEYSDGIKSGFQIGPKDGGYYINFSDSSFYALLSEYLRPKVSELLYGEKD